jgi:hypothetical protein
VGCNKTTMAGILRLRLGLTRAEASLSTDWVHVMKKGQEVTRLVLVKMNVGLEASKQPKK